MPYTPNTPSSSQFQSISQPLIQQNFISLAPFQEGVANFPLVADPTTTNVSIALYAKAVAGVPQLFIRQASSGAVINITTLQSGSSQYSTTLPSGAIMKWGTGTTSAGGTLTVTFTTAFPTNLLSVTVSVADPSGSSVKTDAADSGIRVYNYTRTSFSTVTYAPSTTRPRQTGKFSWFAIGN